MHWMLPQPNQDPERNNCPPPVSAVRCPLSAVRCPLSAVLSVLSGFVQGELEGELVVTIPAELDTDLQDFQDLERGELYGSQLFH
jgi:hypothetical protein